MKKGISTYIFLLSLAFALNVSAQLSIGNTTTADGILFSVDDLTGKKGVHFPDAYINDLSSHAPIVSSLEEGTVVNNTNKFNGSGFHFWNGHTWIPFSRNKVITARFFNLKNIETSAAVNLNSTGVDVEIMDRTVYNDDTSLYVATNDVNGRTTSITVNKDGRYRIIASIGVEQDNGSGGTLLQGRIKLTNSGGAIRFPSGYHYSTEMDRNGTGDDDGTINFTEVVEIHGGERISVLLSTSDGTAPVYLRGRLQASFTIEKIK